MKKEILIPKAKAKAKPKKETTAVRKDYRSELTELFYTKVPRKPTLYEYLKECFQATSSNGITGKFVETFYDKECTKLQCKIARRSFDDLLVISQTLYPKASPASVAKIIFKLHRNDGLRCIFCQKTGKIVFKIDTKVTTTLKGNMAPPLFESNGSSKYSLKNIYELAKEDLL